MKEEEEEDGEGIKKIPFLKRLIDQMGSRIDKNNNTTIKQNRRRRRRSKVWGSKKIPYLNGFSMF